MRPSRLSFVFLALCLAVILGLSPSPVRADSLSVTPPNGMPGTIFHIQASGFGANEGVDLWTQYPDGRVVKLGSSNADGSGLFSFDVSTDSTFPVGSYPLLAHGKASGNNVYGRLIIGGAGSASFSTGTGYCQGQNFAVPGFAAGEQVIFSAQTPGGSVQVLGAVTADGGGTASFTIPLSPGLPVGTYTITGQGLASGHQTSDSLTFDGNTLSGSNCSMTLTGSVPGGYVPGRIPGNIVNYMGPGVYLNTNPSQLYYFDCNWKWRPMGGVVYFLVLGFKPFEPVSVVYELFGQTGNIPYTTTNADSLGNVALAVNTIGMKPAHYHWWFTSPSASYCGHYDLQ